MISFASAAYEISDSLMKLLTTFTANLAYLPGAYGHPKKMEFWKNQPVIWKTCRQNPQPPELIMPRYAEWLNSLPGKPIFISYAMGFDFTFIYWYLIRFTGASPFEDSGIDMHSFAMAYLKKDYLGSGKDTLPASWFNERQVSHLALNDAIDQGALFCNMILANQKDSANDPR